MLHKAGHSNSFIAKQLKVHTSTVWREMKRNSCSSLRLNGERAYWYDPYEANRRTRQRKLKVNQNKRILSTSTNPKLWNVLTKRVERYLRVHHWSPQQISGWMKRKYNMRIATQTIYDWIYLYAKHLKKYLHHIRGSYRRSRDRYIRKHQRDALRALRGIDKRPAEAECRKYFGHWEGDTIVGTKQSGYIATLVERKSGYLIAFLIPKLNKEQRQLDQTDLEVQRLNLAARFADGVSKYMNKTVAPKLQKTLTLDNGSEMSWYEWIEKDTNLKVYFANPYHSWERGTNENTNGLLRFYFPKKSSFEHITQEDVDKAVHLLNNRPRKRLSYRTPHEVLKRSGGIALRDGN